MHHRISGVYAITPDPGLILRDVESAMKAGISVLQYRNKTNDSASRKREATELRVLCRQYGTMFIVNDDIQLAKDVDADGVHLGRGDASYEQARAFLGSKIIGISCYNQLDLAIGAEKLGADYVAFGSFFPSSTKPNAVPADIGLLMQAKQIIKLPIVAIGGITTGNGKQLVRNGADALAVINGIFSADDVFSRVKSYQELFA